MLLIYIYKSILNQSIYQLSQLSQNIDTLNTGIREGY
jgi:hypothetical protein